MTIFVLCCFLRISSTFMPACHHLPLQQRQTAVDSLVGGQMLLLGDKLLKSSHHYQTEFLSSVQHQAFIMRLKGKNTPGFLLKDCTHLSSAAVNTEQVHGSSSSAASENEKGHMVRTLYIFTLTLCSFDSLVCTITFNKQQPHKTEL